MKTSFNEKFFLGKWIYADKPASRLLFHFIITGNLFAFIFGNILRSLEMTTGLIFFLPPGFLWLTWLVNAFLGWLNKWSSETTKEQKEFSWKISTGTCPRCYQKTPRLATKCPHCTADI